MTIYSFWIFDRHCECIYHQDFKRPGRRLRPGTSGSTGAASATSGSTGGPARTPQDVPLSVSDDAKLIFGAIFSIRNMTTKLSGQKESFFSYRTSKYKLHYFETQTSLKFVMITDVTVDGPTVVRPILEQIYAGLYVEYVVKNPLCPVEHGQGNGVGNELFVMGLERFLRPLAIFE
ncbi:Longin-like domain-containing protein [Dipodascopsis tothii]|uniref:Longin-like domain-containing protein n=1 Tax=Dipodascopsis tothii TaxID=44089 RepID=UPI0034CF1797